MCAEQQRRHQRASSMVAPISEKRRSSGLPAGLQMIRSAPYTMKATKCDQLRPLNAKVCIPPQGACQALLSMCAPIRDISARYEQNQISIAR